MAKKVKTALFSKATLGKSARSPDPHSGPSALDLFLQQNPRGSGGVDPVRILMKCPYTAL